MVTGTNFSNSFGVIERMKGKISCPSDYCGQAQSMNSSMNKTVVTETKFKTI